jgi:hypothetical protein
MAETESLLSTCCRNEEETSVIPEQPQDVSVALNYQLLPLKQKIEYVKTKLF